MNESEWVPSLTVGAPSPVAVGRAAPAVTSPAEGATPLVRGASLLSLLTRVATFPQNSLPAPHRHHQNANKYQHLPPTIAHYRQIYRHLHYLHYKPNLPLPALNRQPRVIYHRLPPVMKKYQHAGSVVVKLCISTTDQRRGRRHWPEIRLSAGSQHEGHRHRHKMCTRNRNVLQ